MQETPSLTKASSRSCAKTSVPEEDASAARATLERRRRTRRAARPVTEAGTGHSATTIVPIHDEPVQEGAASSDAAELADCEGPGRVMDRSSPQVLTF